MSNSSETRSRMPGSKERMDTKTMVSVAMFTGLAYIAIFLTTIFPPVMGFLRFDLKDAVLALGGFLFGPAPCALMVVAVCLLEFMTVNPDLPGMVMNIIASGSFCGIASLLYWYRPDFRGAVQGLAVSGLVMTGMMLLWNYAITPLYMGVPRGDVVAMLVPVFLPFNLVKAGLNMGVVLTLYPTVMKLLSSIGFQNLRNDASQEGKGKAFAISFGILAFFILVALVFTGVI